MAQLQCGQPSLSNCFKMFLCISHQFDRVTVKDAESTAKTRNIFTDNFFVYFSFDAQISSVGTPHQDHANRRRALVTKRRKTLPDVNEAELAVDGFGVEQVYRLGRRWTEKISSMNQSPP